MTDKVVAKYLEEYITRSRNNQRRSEIWKVLRKGGLIKYLPRGKNALSNNNEGDQHEVIR